MTDDTNQSLRILVVDDEMDIRDGSERVLTRVGYRVFKAPDGEKALEIVKAESVSIVLLDLKMPGIDGMEILSRIQEIDTSILVIIISGYATVETAIEAMKKGAYDFMVKPFGADQLRIVVTRAHERLRLVRETKEMDRQRRRMLFDLDTEKSRVRTIVESLPNGVVVTNAVGRVVLTNPAFLSQLGLEATWDSGDHISAYVKDKDFCGLVMAISSGEYTGFDDVPTCEISLEGGKYLLAEGRPVLGEDRECLGSVMTLLDITAMKNLDRLKSEFVAEVSHELRSPLSTIHEELAVVIKDMVMEQSPKDQHILSRALEKTQGLIALIGDLLDLSRIEAGHVFQDPEPVHIDILLRNIVEFVGQTARDRDQRLTLALSNKALPPVTADRLALESIFGNLITNALKYTQVGGAITVSASVEGNQITVAVKDNGFGIEKRHLDQIFDRFYRVKDKDTRYITGTGLGLPIVKEILNSLDGSISVESAAGKGSTFTVVLPLG